MTDTERLLDKVKKLMALQESALKLGNIAEAANAAEKIQNIVYKYNLDVSKISASEAKVDANIDKLEINLAALEFNPKHGLWILSLANTLAKAYLCRCVRNFHGNIITLDIIGNKENITVVGFMLGQLVTRLPDMEKRRWKELEAVSSIKRGKFRRDYLVGAVMGIQTQLRKNEEAKAKEPGMTSLVLYNEEAVAVFMEKTYPNLRTSRRKSRDSNIASGIGYSDGKEMSLHKGYLQ